MNTFESVEVDRTHTTGEGIDAGARRGLRSEGGHDLFFISLAKNGQLDTRGGLSKLAFEGGDDGIAKVAHANASITLHLIPSRHEGRHCSPASHPSASLVASLQAPGCNPAAKPLPQAVRAPWLPSAPGWGCDSRNQRTDGDLMVSLITLVARHLDPPVEC